MSAVLDMEIVPIVVEDVILDLVKSTADELWSAMREVDPRDRVGRSQLHGLAEIARNQPELLEGFIEHQRRRAESAAKEGPGGGVQPHVRFWSVLRAQLRALETKLSQRFLPSDSGLSRSERQELLRELLETFIPIWALFVSIEYQYLAMIQGD